MQICKQLCLKLMKSHIHQWSHETKKSSKKTKDHLRHCTPPFKHHREQIIHPIPMKKPFIIEIVTE